VAAGVAWGAVGAGFVAVILAAVLFRVDVVRLWPKTASAYAFAKMPVNPTGLTFEGVQGKPNLIHGRAALTVTGVERNIETEPRPAMPLRVILLDRSGKRLASAVSAPPTLRLAAGAGRPFSVDFLDPPADVSSALVEVDFDKPPPPPPPPPRPAAPPAATSPSPAAARNPAPAAEAVPLAPIRAQNARPLPADSPYALPPAARQQASR
jgi:hypothetical protein